MGKVYTFEDRKFVKSNILYLIIQCSILRLFETGSYAGFWQQNQQLLDSSGKVFVENLFTEWDIAAQKFHREKLNKGKGKNFS